MGEVWAFASELMKFLMVVPVSQTYINFKIFSERTFTGEHLIADDKNDVAIFIRSGPKVKTGKNSAARWTSSQIYFALVIIGHTSKRLTNKVRWINQQQNYGCMMLSKCSLLLHMLRV